MKCLWKPMFKFICIIFSNDPINNEYWHCSMLGSTFTTPYISNVGRTKSLALRDQDGIQMLDEMSHNIVTMKKPLDWIVIMYNRMLLLNIKIGLINGFIT